MKDAAFQMIRSQFRPKLIFNFMVDLLRQKHIELPPYNTLLTIITDAIAAYDESLIHRLGIALTAEQKTALDSLIQTQNESYELTSLKNFRPELTNKNILSNVEKLKTLQAIFKQIEPLLSTLDLNGDAIRYYGELVKHYRVQQITRRSALSRYLHLLTFTAYQVFSFEDWLTDTLLTTCRRTLNLSYKNYQSKQLEEI